jgi:phosphate starvation-inducible PhoH-like protein
MYVVDGSNSFLGNRLSSEVGILENEGNKNEPKRKSRKTKKPSEKEILNSFYANDDELEREKPNNNNNKPKKTTDYQKTEKPFEFMQHLSAKERQNFESKFTKPKNERQEQYVHLLKQKHKKIVVSSGPAGTGKTLFATEFGVRNFLNGTYEKLVFTRPSVSVDEELGFLPGTLEEKMAPWIRPIYDVLYNFITPKEVTTLLEEKLIEIAPLGYMRGRTFKNTWIVADEMQNSTISQMKMLMTRLGENSRLVITGDLEQHDRFNEVNGLEDFLEKFKGKRSSSISSFEFQRGDIQREEVVKEVLDIYSCECTPNYYSIEQTETGTEEKSNLGIYAEAPIT